MSVHVSQEAVATITAEYDEDVGVSATSGRLRLRAKAEVPEDAVQKLVNFHGKLGELIFDLRRQIIGKEHDKIREKKCKGVECYGCPVACPEKGYDIPPGNAPA